MFGVRGGGLTAGEGGAFSNTVFPYGRKRGRGFDNGLRDGYNWGWPLPVAAGDAKIGRREKMAEADFTSYYDFR